MRESDAKFNDACTAKAGNSLKVLLALPMLLLELDAKMRVA